MHVNGAVPTCVMQYRHAIQMLGKAIFYASFAMVQNALVCDAQESAGLSHLCALPTVDVNGCPGAKQTNMPQPAALMGWSCHLTLHV